MTFTFCWADDGDIFDPQVHTNQDLAIFDFEISGQEAQVPWARLRVKNPRCGLNTFAHRTAFLSYRKSTGEVELLFKGRLISVSQRLEGESVELYLTAQPLDMQEKLLSLHQELQQTDLWDPLFVACENRQDPRESLESRIQLYYWSRTTGALGLSDLFQGRQSLDLEGNFYADSLDVRLSEMPLQGVRVYLKATWLQRFAGVSDLTYLLRSRFPGALINSLTGQDLEAKWWRTGEKLGQSGYWVDYSELREITPPRTGPLNVYPAYSAKLWVSPQDPAVGNITAPKQIRLKRRWYRAKLLLGWRYKQKRTEIADIFLTQRTQSMGAPLSKVRTLNISLQGLDLVDEYDPWQPKIRYTTGFRVVWEDKVYRCVDAHRSRRSFDDVERGFWECLGPIPDWRDRASQASFFTTQRGHRAVAHGLEIAKAHLAASSRAVEIRVSAPFETLSSVTCDHSVRLEDPRLPGRRVQGKVTSYRLLGDGKTGVFRGELVLACAVGPQEPQGSMAVGHVSSLLPYVMEDTPQACVSPSGIVFESFYHQRPKRGLLNPQGMGAVDLVEELHVRGLPDDQNAHLLENQYPRRHHLLGALREVKTDIFVRLKDLRSAGNLKHTIYVKTLTPWQAPCHIDLGAPPQD